jgi:hypothetical protein
MTGNNFRPDVVARIIELVRTGDTDLGAAIRREYPELTALGIERVFDIARGEIAGEAGDSRAEVQNRDPPQGGWCVKIGEVSRSTRPIEGPSAGRPIDRRFCEKWGSA